MQHPHLIHGSPTGTWLKQLYLPTLLCVLAALQLDAGAATIMSAYMSPGVIPARRARQSSICASIGAVASKRSAVAAQNVASPCAPIARNIATARAKIGRAASSPSRLKVVQAINPSPSPPIRDGT